MENQRMIECCGEIFDLNAIRYITKVKQSEISFSTLMFEVGFDSGVVVIKLEKPEQHWSETMPEINKIRDELIGMLSVEKIMQII